MSGAKVINPSPISVFPLSQNWTMFAWETLEFRVLALDAHERWIEQERAVIPFDSLRDRYSSELVMRSVAIDVTDDRKTRAQPSTR